MDFTIWSILESDVSVKSYSSVAALKHALLAPLSALDEEVVRRSRHSVTSRLELIVEAKRSVIYYQYTFKSVFQISLSSLRYILKNKMGHPVHTYIYMSLCFPGVCRGGGSPGAVCRCLWGLTLRATRVGRSSKGTTQAPYGGLHSATAQVG